MNARRRYRYRRAPGRRNRFLMWAQCRLMRASVAEQIGDKLLAAELRASLADVFHLASE